MRTRRELRRIEVRALRLLDGSVHSAGPDLDAAAQQGGNVLQECIAALTRAHPGIEPELPAQRPLHDAHPIAGLEPREAFSRAEIAGALTRMLREASRQAC